MYLVLCVTHSTVGETSCIPQLLTKNARMALATARHLYARAGAHLFSSVFIYKIEPERAGSKFTITAFEARPGAKSDMWQEKIRDMTLRKAAKEITPDREIY